MPRRGLTAGMFSVVGGNQLEELADRMVGWLRESPAPPLVPDVVVVQSAGMARWLSLRMARTLGIAANVRFPLPARFLWGTFRTLVPDVPESSPLEPGVAVWHLRALLDDLDGTPQDTRQDTQRFAALHAYLRSADERGRHDLAARIADLFDQYLVYRPAWITRWEGGADEGWQAALWRRLVARIAEPHRARVQAAAMRALAAAPPGVLPRRVAVFGIPTMPPAYLHGFRHLGDHVDVHLFLLGPSREYWGDLRRSRRGGAAEVHAEAGAPLLATLGRQGREFLDLVLECEPHREDEAFVDPGDDCLLHALQSDMLTLRARVGRRAIAPDDRSVQVHVCHGAMREVEVLHDQLLWLFERHPDLTAADVVVMTPDIDAYAPCIEAVFGGTQGPRHIPFSIADRGLRSESPLVEAFLGLLDLVGSRYDADRLLALLDIPALHRRFGFAGGDLDLVQRLVAESTVRWGVDAASRARRGLPAVAEHTWRFGLDRLLLGYVLPSGDARVVGDLAPCDAVEGSDAQVLGRLAAFVEAAAGLDDDLAAPRAMTAWAATLTDVLGRFLDPADDEEPAAQALRAALQELADDARRARYEAPVSLDLVRALLRREVERPRATARFLGGGVTFCAMVPMRSIPFAVVCLIGMGDGSFPRARPPLSFDLMADRPERGDRSRRDDDRYLFLEAILSARRCLYLSYVGRGIRDNAPIPPSIVVSELLDHLRRGFEVDEGRLATVHPLQAFSPRYFAPAPEPGLVSYSAELCEASRMRRSGRAGARRLLEGRLPASTAAVVELDAFLQFFANPTAHLLRRRLGIRLEEAELPVSHREPFVLDGLAAFTLRTELLARLTEGRPRDALLRELGARGLLPHGRVGEVELGRQRAVVEDFAERLAACAGGEPGETIPFDLALGGMQLRGELREVVRDGLLDYRLSRPKARDQLRLWIRHLLLHAVRPRPEGWVSTWLGTKEAILFGAVAEPRPALAALAEIYQEGQHRLLPLFPATSLAWAEAETGKRDEARQVWEGNDYADGERVDAHLAYAWREVDPLDAEFERLAERVMAPLVAHRRQERS